MADVSDLYHLRSPREDEIGLISQEVYRSFNHVSFTLSQLNLSRQTIDDWIRFELATEHQRSHCFALIHNKTESVCGVLLHKSHWMMTLPLPQELSAIAPRYYLLQSIHTKYTNELGLDPAKVMYGDFWFVNEQHQGNRISEKFEAQLMQNFQQMGYTGLISEVSNPHLLQLAKSAGINVLADLNAVDFEFDGTKPFMKDTPLLVYYRPLGAPPKL